MSTRQIFLGLLFCIFWPALATAETYILNIAADDEMFRKPFFEVAELGALRDWKITNIGLAPYKNDDNISYKERLEQLEIEPNYATFHVIPFDALEIRTALLHLTEKIGKAIKKKDRILIVINAHGGLSGGQFIFGSNNSPFFIDEALLRELSQRAALFQVPLGILLGSCHSGAAIPLFSDSTCVITSSPENKLNYSHFGANFFTPKYPDNANTLESLYLQSRENNDDPARWMISSPEGIILHQYFSFLDDASDIAYEIRDQNEKGDYVAKEIPFAEPSTLLKLISSPQPFGTSEQSQLDLSNEESWGIDLWDLRTLVEKYRKMRKIFETHDLRKTCFSLDPDYMPTSEVCFKSETEVFPYFNSIADAIQKQMGCQIYYRENFHCLDKNSKKKSPALLSKLNYIRTAYSKISDLLYFPSDPIRSENGNKLDLLAQSVIHEERVAYSAIYRKLTKMLNTSNPCRSFTIP